MATTYTIQVDANHRLRFAWCWTLSATAEAERSQSSVLQPVQNDCLSNGASFGGWLARSPPDKAV